MIHWYYFEHDDAPGVPYLDIKPPRYAFTFGKHYGRKLKIKKKLPGWKPRRYDGSRDDFGRFLPARSQSR